MTDPSACFNPILLSAGFARHNADWNWKNVSSPFTRLYLVTQGEGWVHLKNKTLHLTPNHLYIIPAHTRHDYECTGVFNHYYLHFYEPDKQSISIHDYYIFPDSGLDAKPYDANIFQSICDSHPAGALKQSNPKTYDNAVGFADYVRLFTELPPSTKMRIKGLLFTLMARFIETARPRIMVSDARIYAVLKFIRSNISSPIEISDLASIACLSQQHLIRLFKQNFNMPPMQFVTNKKIELAELLLLTTDKPVKAISNDVGIADHSYFIRLFKKHIGVTPASYRCNMCQ